MYISLDAILFGPRSNDGCTLAVQVLAAGVAQIDLVFLCVLMLQCLCCAPIRCQKYTVRFVLLSCLAQATITPMVANKCTVACQ